MDKLIFIVGFIIFSIYLGCLVYVISTQNKIQEILEDEDPELNS
jgi:regulatory protein YycI of two-component signal transduction system YycFG